MILGFSDEQLLNKRMIFFDASNMKFRNVKIRERNPGCAVCGDSPTIADVSQFNYDDFCQTSCNLYDQIIIPKENNITVEEFDKYYNESIVAKRGDCVLIDVRPKV